MQMDIIPLETQLVNKYINVGCICIWNEKALRETQDDGRPKTRKIFLFRSGTFGALFDKRAEEARQSFFSVLYSCKSVSSHLCHREMGVINRRFFSYIQHNAK
jgi:hypothetical protein